MVVKKIKISPEKALDYLREQRKIKEYLENRVFKTKSLNFEQKLSCLIYLENLISYELLSLIQLRNLFLNMKFLVIKNGRKSNKIQEKIRFDAPQDLEKKTLGQLISIFKLGFEDENLKKNLERFVELRNDFIHSLLIFPPAYLLKDLQVKLKESLRCGKIGYKNLKKLNKEFLKEIEKQVREVL